MKTRFLLYIALLPVLLSGCSSTDKASDAQGTFEADEVIVSSEVPGKIKSLNIDEGSVLKKDSVIGVIDSVPLELQKAQLEASISALHQKTMDVAPQVKLLKDQIAVLKAQLDNAITERDRTSRLLKSDAATQQQLDNWNNQVEVLKKQIAASSQQIQVQETTTGTQNNSVLSEAKPLKKSVAQIDDQLKRTFITSPINGTVLTKYAMAGEVTAAGKALYKIADLSVITLRAYITDTQLAQLKLGQKVSVLVDSTASSYKTYPGVVYYISDKAEFTPKTIQTKDERANLVYAVKIHVKNDGYLKIGMYGEVQFNQTK